MLFFVLLLLLEAGTEAAEAAVVSVVLVLGRLEEEAVLSTTVLFALFVLLSSLSRFRFRDSWLGAGRGAGAAVAVAACCDWFGGLVAVVAESRRVVSSKDGSSVAVIFVVEVEVEAKAKADGASGNCGGETTNSSSIVSRFSARIERRECAVQFSIDAIAIRDKSKQTNSYKIRQHSVGLDLWNVLSYCLKCRLRNKTF